MGGRGMVLLIQEAVLGVGRFLPDVPVASCVLCFETSLLVGWQR